MSYGAGSSSSNNTLRNQIVTGLPGRDPDADPAASCTLALAA